MSESLVFLDNALALAKREKTALEQGEYEEAIRLAEERGRLANAAWNMFEMADNTAYRAKLLEISTLQAQLTSLATSARDKIRSAINRSRQEKKRIQGYHLAVGQALQ